MSLYTERRIPTDDLWMEHARAVANERAATRRRLVLLALAVAVTLAGWLAGTAATQWMTAANAAALEEL